MTIQIINGPVIAAGQSLSAAIDVSAGPIVRVTSPVNWWPADLTFQGSTDGVFYNDLYDELGNELTLACAAGRGIVLADPLRFANVKFVKFRSGRAGNPLAQREQVTFAVAIDDAPLGSGPPVPPVGPAAIGASTVGGALDITFDGPLDPLVVPPPKAFIVIDDGVPSFPNNVLIGGPGNVRVTLLLAAPMAGAVKLVTYRPAPEHTKLKGTNGGDCPPFEDGPLVTGED